MFEVKISEFSIETQKVIKNLDVVLIGFPNIIVMCSWNRTRITPTFLNMFEAFVSGVYVFLNIDQPLEFLNDFKTLR